jgi:hypothetical protein
VDYNLLNLKDAFCASFTLIQDKFSSELKQFELFRKNTHISNQRLTIFSYMRRTTSNKNIFSKELFVEQKEPLGLSATELNF